MKTWMCLICGFIYDEAQGRPEDGIAPGTRISTLGRGGSDTSAVAVAAGVGAEFLELDIEPLNRFETDFLNTCD